ncbi:MAG: cyclic nucleotide-binding domain-containing protein, partial [Alphaproteobacteria bacterium]
MPSPRGSAAENAFVVVSGSVCVEVDADTPLIVGPGEMVGDIDLMPGQTHSTAVVALEPVSAVRLSRIQLASALRTAPRVSAADMRELFAGLARRIAERALSVPAQPETEPAEAPPQWHT